MIIIADSGSTKTDWVLAAPSGEIIKSEHTEGINPIHQSEKQISDILASLDGFSQASRVFFYGSGLRPEYQALMQQLLSDALNIPPTDIETESDLLGAARALCGHHEGIACILGTGANSCLYDGKQIVKNTPPLGYILGDEGSGAVIGRHFLNGIYKGTLPAELRDAFEAHTGMTMADVIQRVYRQPLANRWMASLSRFICTQTEYYPALDMMITACFREFLQRNVIAYHRPDLPLAATGSIAFYYRRQLAEACKLEGLCLKKTEQNPMKGLLRYHCGK